MWGLVSMGTALVQGFKGLFFVRFALGFCEAPFFPVGSSVRGKGANTYG